MLESFYKRLVILGIVVGCAGYAITLALTPWVFIAWFLFYRSDYV